MDTESIITELEAERDRLQQAISALQRSGNHRGRAGRKATKGGRRHYSAASRKKIADAARKRWAKVKAAGKNSL
ncbi:MAG: hypothetical protein ACRD4F_09450 [Candidatus Angelobacter sp.]